MVEWHHRFKGHELGQTPGHGKGQESLVCCSPWGHKESDMTWQLNNNKYLFLAIDFFKTSLFLTPSLPGTFKIFARFQKIGQLLSRR